MVVRTPISYKYWHQSPTWLPEDGSSLQVLTTRPDLRGVGDAQVQVSPFKKSAMQGLAALQKSVLKWMIERKRLDLATENDIELWRAHFARIPAKLPSASNYPLQFPVRASDSSSSSSSSSTLSVVALPTVSESRRHALGNLVQKVLGEQKGPSVEPIPHPGYSDKERKKQERQAQGQVARGRGARSGSSVRGRGVRGGRGPGPRAWIAVARLGGEGGLGSGGRHPVVWLWRTCWRKLQTRR
jgi:hypothetical protein